jgi:hypothetical protein
MATNSEPRFFQWLVGERRGEVLVFDELLEEEGDIFIKFKDNSRINENLVLPLNHSDPTNKMMAEVENMSKLWLFKEEIVGEDTNRTEIDWESQTKYDVPTVTEIASDGQKVPSKRKKIELIPPARTRPEIVESKFGIVKTTPAPIPPPAPTLDAIIEINDPVYIMMDKAKKIDTEVEMTLTISLPGKNLFNVASESFDKGDEKALEYIIENIDITDIKDALKKGIAEMYGTVLWDKEEHIGVTEKGVVIHPDNKEELGISEDKTPTSSRLLENVSGTEIFEPECIEEPIIKDAIPEEILDEIDLKEK